MIIWLFECKGGSQQTLILINRTFFIAQDCGLKKLYKYTKIRVRVS